LTQREAKTFENDPEIIAMTDLKKGFEKNDISLVIKTIGDKRNNIMADPLIAQYLDELLRSVRL